MIPFILLGFGILLIFLGILALAIYFVACLIYGHLTYEEETDKK